MIRVVLADDHHLIRQGIRAILEKTGDIEVIGEAKDGLEAVVLAESLKPDLIIMDIIMPRFNGIQALKKIGLLGLETKVIILSMYSDPIIVRYALKNGAKGYLLKTSVTAELLIAIHAAIGDEIYLSPPVAKDFIKEALISHNEPSLLDLLSPREIEVLKLIAEGHTNNAIGQILGISVKTVEKHRMSLMNKLDIHDTAGLVRTAVKFRLISIYD
ncbi:MAG: response regulator [Bacillota bacterium]